MLRKGLIAVILLGFLGLSCGKKQETPVIKIPLVTWGGYAALFAANNGPEPKEDSLFYKYGKFKVQLVQEEDVANQMQGFANGTYQIIWSTMDMLPIMYDSLSKDSRTVPQVIGLFDLSAGGDGIIVRGDIKNAADMKGKKIVTAQYTPSHTFILWYLKQAGLTEKDVQMAFAASAIAAKDTFIAEESIDVCVTWSPFIYDLTDPKKDSYVKGALLLESSAKGSASHGLIADVYLARADLVKEHPEMIKAFTRAMIEGYDLFSADKEKIAEMIGKFFGLKGGKDEVMAMFGDVIIAGKAENSAFFTPSTPFSAEEILTESLNLYKENGALPADYTVDPKQVISPDFILENAK